MLNKKTYTINGKTFTRYEVKQADYSECSEIQMTSEYWKVLRGLIHFRDCLATLKKLESKFVKESELSEMINDYNLILNVANAQVHSDQALDGLCNTLSYLLNKIKEYKTTTIADGIKKVYFIANLIHEQSKQGIFVEEDLASTMLSSIDLVINQ